jgi:hypothetical protein
MIGPTWLAAIFGAVAIAAAAAALVRIFVAWRSHRATDLEVDIHNAVMGVSMAGMLIPSLFIVTPGASTTTWLIVWILIAVWFAASVFRDVGPSRAGRRFGGHHLPHLVMSAAMIYMFAVSGPGDSMSSSAQMSGMSGMPGMAGGGLVALPTLDYAFTIFMIGYAVLVIDRLPAIAVAGSGDLRTLGHRTGAKANTPLAPRVAAGTNILMAVTMGYMLTMMFV